MASLTAQDVPMIIKSSVINSERRVTPSWSISQFKAKMEPITGIPPSCQTLSLRTPGRDAVNLAAADEDATRVGNWELQPYAEIYITDTRPTGTADLSFTPTDPSAVPKYTMPAETYSELSNSVLAWKKANKLGRFDPSAPEVERSKLEKLWADVETHGVVVGNRCQLGMEAAKRRGEVAYVGEVAEIPGLKGPWVGVVLDEPTGKNDGSVGGKRYFECADNRGIFVRPERVEVGDFEVLDDGLDENLEEI